MYSSMTDMFEFDWLEEIIKSEKFSIFYTPVCVVMLYTCN